MANLHRANHSVRETPTKFPLGQVVATPGALAALQESGEEPSPSLQRHNGGDWGELNEHDMRENETSLQDALVQTRLADKMTMCRRKRCKSPCFFRTRKSQKYCSTHCARLVNLAGKLRYYHEVGKERRRRMN